MFLSKCFIAIGGILTLLIAIFHSRFHVLFNWENELIKLSKPNQRTMVTINVALIVLLFFFSLISFAYMNELAQHHGIAFGILLFFSIFWAWRTFWQIFYYRKPKEISMFDRRLFLHYVLIVVFGFLTISYFAPLIIV